MDKDELLKSMAQAVVDMEEEQTAELCRQSLREGVPAKEALYQGLIPGMDEVSRLYAESEYFVPEVLSASDAMYAGLDVLKPHIETERGDKTVKVVIGVVRGDTHDIGKNIVKMMMETSGAEMFDLGRDVAVERFVEKAEEVGAQVIAMSTLMSTTLVGMKKLVEVLVGRGLRPKYKVMVGGGPVSPEFCRRIGADLYAKDAAEAVKVLKAEYRLTR